VTRKTKLVLAGGVILAGAAVVAALCLNRNGPSSEDPAPQTASTPAPNPAPPTAKEEPPDPQVLSLIHEAYQSSLAETAPPGMIELGKGSGTPAKPGELPPLPDGHVTPVHYNPGPSPDLPPLPPLPSPSASPPAVPPSEPSPASGKPPKEVPSKDLPPLPSVPKSDAPK
jgi:hypothetical protein